VPLCSPGLRPMDTHTIAPDPGPCLAAIDWVAPSKVNLGMQTGTESFSKRPVRHAVPRPMVDGGISQKAARLWYA